MEPISAPALISPIIVLAGALLLTLFYPIIVKVRNKSAFIRLDYLTTCYFLGISFFTALRFLVKHIELVAQQTELNAESIYIIGASLVVMYNAVTTYISKTFG